MSLSDIMSNLRLDAYAEIALVLFLLAFAAIAVNVLSRSRESTARSAGLPLADDADGQGAGGHRVEGAADSGGAR